MNQPVAWEDNKVKDLNQINNNQLPFRVTWLNSDTKAIPSKVTWSLVKDINKTFTWEVSQSCKLNLSKI